MAEHRPADEPGYETCFGLPIGTMPTDTMMVGGVLICKGIEADGTLKYWAVSTGSMHFVEIVGMLESFSDSFKARMNSSDYGSG